MNETPKARIRLSEGEWQLCNLIKQKEVELVADELGIKVGTIYKKFYRLRLRIEDAQQLINDTNNLKKSSARLRKFLTKDPLRARKEEDTDEPEEA